MVVVRVSQFLLTVTTAIRKEKVYVMGGFCSGNGVVLGCARTYLTH